VRVAVVPAPHDPDSFIKANSGDAFRKLIEGAEGFFDYYLNRLCATNDIATDKGRLAVLREMAQAVHKTGNVVLMDKYAQKTALRLGVSPEAVRAEFKKTPAVRSSPGPTTEEPGESFEVSTETSRPSTHEFWLLKLLFLNEELVGWGAMHLEPDWIQHAAVREIVSRRLAAQAGETWTNLAGFLDQCESPEMQNLITEAVAEDRAIPNPEQQLTDVTLRLRNQFLDRKLAALTHRASQPETNATERDALLREQQQLRQLKRQPLAQLADSR